MPPLEPEIEALLRDPVAADPISRDAVDIGKPFVPTAADSPHSRARDGLSHSSRGEGLDDRKLCDELAKLDEHNARAAIRHLLLEIRAR